MFSVVGMFIRGGTMTQEFGALPNPETLRYIWRIFFRTRPNHEDIKLFGCSIERFVELDDYSWPRMLIRDYIIGDYRYWLMKSAFKEEAAWRMFDLFKPKEFEYSDLLYIAKKVPCFECVATRWLFQGSWRQQQAVIILPPPP